MSFFTSLPAYKITLKTELCSSVFATVFVMVRLQSNLKTVKSRVRSINRETVNTLNAISREQKILFDFYMKLRQVLKENERVKDVQLTKLCTESEAALKNLRESLDLAEKIVKLGRNNPNKIKHEHRMLETFRRNSGLSHHSHPPPPAL